MYKVQNKVISFPQEIFYPFGFRVIDNPRNLPQNYFTEIFFMKGGYCIKSK